MTDQIDILSFGEAGLRIACRRNTIDEQAALPWMDWPKRYATGPYRAAPSDVILDVGAHIGGFSLAASEVVPRGRILALEPCLESYEVLVRNVELNGLTNVVADRLALLDRSGEVLLYHSPKGNWGHTTTKSTLEGSEIVQTTTLDAYLQQRAVERCGLAKFNCEGAEFPVLINASEQTLHRMSLMVVFYHLDLVDDRWTLTDLIDRLRSAGFDVEHFRATDVRGRLHARLRV